MINLLQCIEIFASVADCQSFTRAAGLLRISPTKTSNYVVQLEKHLGTRLIDRSTRHFRLTKEGTIYLEHCRSILAAITEASAAVTDVNDNPSGRVRVDLAVTLAAHLVVPSLGSFIARYPEIDLDLLHTPHLFDMAGEGYDVTFRVGDLPDTSLIGRLLGKFRQITVASPAYFESHGRPATPDELAKHRCLHFIDPHTLRPLPWAFQKDGILSQITPQRGMAFNEGESRLIAGTMGLGIFQALEFYVEHLIKNGELIPVLTEWEPPPAAIWLAYPKNRHLAARTKAFIDHMVEVFSARNRALSP